jgi:hypothetical protein
MIGAALIGIAAFAFVTIGLGWISRDDLKRQAEWRRDLEERRQRLADRRARRERGF